MKTLKELKDYIAKLKKRLKAELPKVSKQIKFYEEKNR